jgi:hypothetical protein
VVVVDQARSGVLRLIRRANGTVSSFDLALAAGLITAVAVGRDNRAYVARGLEVLAFDIDRVAPG